MTRAGRVPGARHDVNELKKALLESAKSFGHEMLSGGWYYVGQVGEKKGLTIGPFSSKKMREIETLSVLHP